MEFLQVGAEEGDEVVGFLTGEEWPFHVKVTVDGSTARARFEAGDFAHAFWVSDDGVRLGMVRLMDLDDGTPLFDLRVRAVGRGRGVGTAAVRWLTSHVFTNFATNRIEGTTRQDNRAMRRVFDKCGWVKEAHYRDAWPGDGRCYDSVGYAILRRDWEGGTTTLVDWNG